jgi:hypothetical protein
MSRRVRTFLHDSTPLKCPDCAHETFVRVSSLLGHTDTANLVVSAPLLRHILADYRARWAKKGVQCAKCDLLKPGAYWLLLHENDAHGPWCLPCLRAVVWQDIEDEKGLTQDLSVLTLSASALNYRIANNVTVEELLPEVVKLESLLF